jgi:hypothetical protein
MATQIKYRYSVDAECHCYAPAGDVSHSEQSGRIFDWKAGGFNQVPLPHPCTIHVKYYQNPMWIEVTNDLRKEDQ